MTFPAIAVVCCIFPWPSPGDDWPGFRGPTGMGLTDEKNPPVEWGGPDGKNIVWKSPLKGDGHASPAVAGGRMFLVGTKRVYCIGKK